MNSVDIVNDLRSLVPPKPRPLFTAEALKLAETQAGRLLRLSGVEAPPASEEIIAQLPAIQVERIEHTRVQAASEWSNGRWLILLNGSMSRGRQRFSLAHEFKHILD